MPQLMNSCSSVVGFRSYISPFLFACHLLRMSLAAMVGCHWLGLSNVGLEKHSWNNSDSVEYRLAHDYELCLFPYVSIQVLRGAPQ